ncbi:uncharacterized protein BDR25DRAFT_348158 [Lindgomyces ingoldianus]|uniref:Uncharacterized protein n=1 Tax=Lindgomyces ingoldianus TaxID=673940 RepID=A0ACB6RFL4_9PLEO|nr:uncharacterized protein BDR25DRAFT_348158 [Lindgomyces ingoldianus]KAF2477840.1 hypothetical protein BDR25DRAFT_348158 [Lindgomyces ingoldianus]
MPEGQSSVEEMKSVGVGVGILARLLTTSTAIRELERQRFQEAKYDEYERGKAGIKDLTQPQPSASFLADRIKRTQNVTTLRPVLLRDKLSSFFVGEFLLKGWDLVSVAWWLVLTSTGKSRRLVGYADFFLELGRMPTGRKFLSGNTDPMCASRLLWQPDGAISGPDREPIANSTQAVQSLLSDESVREPEFSVQHSRGCGERHSLTGVGFFDSAVLDQISSCMMQTGSSDCPSLLRAVFRHSIGFLALLLTEPRGFSRLRGSVFATFVQTAHENNDYIESRRWPNNCRRWSALAPEHAANRHRPPQIIDEEKRGLRRARPGIAHCCSRPRSQMMLGANESRYKHASEIIVVACSRPTRSQKSFGPFFALSLSLTLLLLLLPLLCNVPSIAHIRSSSGSTLSAPALGRPRCCDRQNDPTRNIAARQPSPETQSLNHRPRASFIDQWPPYSFRSDISLIICDALLIIDTSHRPTFACAPHLDAQEQHWEVALQLAGEPLHHGFRDQPRNTNLNTKRSHPKSFASLRTWNHIENESLKRGNELRTGEFECWPSLACRSKLPVFLSNTGSSEVMKFAENQIHVESTTYFDKPHVDRSL